MAAASDDIDLRVLRRREYIGHFAFEALHWRDDADIYTTAGDLTRETLDRVVPEVDG